MRAALIAVTALAIRAQTPSDPTDVLAHARDNMVERAKRLPNYTCVQTVDREYFVRSTPHASVRILRSDERRSPQEALLT